MGDFRMIGSKVGSGANEGPVRMAGRFTHQGPFTTLSLPGGGSGRFSWNGNLGSGPVMVKGQVFDVRLSYLSSGHYTFEVRHCDVVTYRGRVREDPSVLPPNSSTD